MNENGNALEDQFYLPVEKFFLMDIGGTEGFWLLFITVALLAMLTYKLGFAKKLPLLKSIVVYVLLVFGCFMLVIFAIGGLPIAEVLIITSIVLGIYRYRLHRERDAK
ncbi:YlaH-like family protein [Piscibacillus salipiscarius]|uniref:YlaH-like family protein n=2 Tax=Piscibacillus salipiscarius TaxID=299480 RepID=A0ABW5QCF6_9BACI